MGKGKKELLSNNTHSLRQVYCTREQEKTRESGWCLSDAAKSIMDWRCQQHCRVCSCSVDLHSFMICLSTHCMCFVIFLSAWFHPVSAFCTVAEMFLTSTTLKVLLFSSRFFDLSAFGSVTTKTFSKLRYTRFLWWHYREKKSKKKRACVLDLLADIICRRHHTWVCMRFCRGRVRSEFCEDECEWCDEDDAEALLSLSKCA